jgi:hypothetical protein
VVAACVLGKERGTLDALERPNEGTREARVPTLLGFSWQARFLSLSFLFSVGEVSERHWICRVWTVQISFRSYPWGE